MKTWLRWLDRSSQQQVPWLSAYWFSYTNGLDRGDLERLAEEYFLRAPDGSIVLLDALAAAGRTYQSLLTDNIQVAKGMGERDVFNIFNQARQNAKREDAIEIGAWIEASTYTFCYEDSKTRSRKLLYSDWAEKRGAILNPICNGASQLDYHLDEYKRVFFDPFDSSIFAQNQKIVAELAGREEIDIIFFDDHFGLDNRNKKLENGEIFNLKKAIIDKYSRAENFPPELNERERWISDRFTEQIQQLSAVVRSFQKEFAISIGGSFHFAKNTNYQDIEQWLQIENLDRLDVQLYRANNRSLIRELAKLRENLDRLPKAKQIPTSISLAAIANGQKLTPKQIQQQINLVRQYGFEAIGFHYHTYPKAVN